MSQVVARLETLASGGKLPGTLAFNFKTLGFIRPAGVTFLNNLMEWFHVKGVRVTFDGLECYSPPISYLDDSLFFERHFGKKLNVRSQPRSTTIPLKRVCNAESHMWLQNTFTPWLASRLGLTKSSLYAFQTCASELFNNVQDHSQYDIGCIFVQHFPNESRVIICISDFGRGIPDGVRQVLPALDDVQAVLKSVEDGFTTKSTPRNLGAGLEYLLRTVVNTGSVTIYSGEAIICFRGASGCIVPEVIARTGFSPGTLVEIELRTDTIVPVPDEPEEFEW